MSLLLALGMTLWAGNAAASYEQVANFAGKPGKPAEGVFPEEVQLGGVSGIAINSTGAGGVPAGTIYAVSKSPGKGAEVARYNPDGSFSEAWTIAPSYQSYERCGPEGEPAHPTCKPGIDGGGDRSLDVEVDQSTGNVYTLYKTELTDYEPADADGAVKVYSADGSQIIAHFVPISRSNEPTSANPGKVFQPQSLAVTSDGTVYVADNNVYHIGSENFEHHRVVIWKPESPGNYEKYVYTGESSDIAPGDSSETWPRELAADDAGNIYGNQEEVIVEYDPSEPTKPICRFNQPDGGITQMTVDPRNGEVFYFDYKNKRIHGLSPCNGKGEFVETSTIALSPSRKTIQPLGFDPLRSWSLGRPTGTLFAGSPEPELFSGESSLGYIFAPPKELPPTVSGESVSAVTAGSALLHGFINPNSSTTRYAFQYLADAAYNANPPGEEFLGAAEAPLGGSLIEGAETLPVQVAVSGLSPETTYHYRLIATSHCSEGEPAKVCEAVGADEEFNTYPVEAIDLTDHRAYELVSPVDKQGGEVVPVNQIGSCSECKPGGLGFRAGPMQSALDGESFVYAGTPFSHTQGGGQENEYYARRTAEGWQTTTLSPDAQTRGELQGYEAFNRDNTKGILYLTQAQLGDAPAGYPNLYAQSTAAASLFGPLLSSAPPNRAEGTGNNSLAIHYGGASEDFSRSFFSANDALTAPTPFAPEAVDDGFTSNNLYEKSDGELRLVNVEPGNTEATPGAKFGASVEADGTRAVSSDGSRVFWSAAGKTYVRIDAEYTREIPDPSARYLTAARDGSRVLMSDGKVYGQLEAPTPVEEFDLSEGKGGFEGVAGQSEDLSRIYFVDTAVLDEAPGAQSGVAEAGKNNLYAWDEGSPRFIAQLKNEDGAASRGTDWAASPTGRTAEASPAGGWLAFVSAGRLTPYNNVGPCHNNFGKIEAAPCEEVYLYDAATDSVSCPSCTRSNQPPLNNHSLLKVMYENGEVGEQLRYLTDSGRLYFDTSNSLVPRDTNEGVEDVYESEPNGVGTCTRVEGCISLISAGTSLIDSNLVGIDESGENVFFTSRDQLTLKDKDDLMDLYDAREGGGIPAESEVARSECQGEACQPVPVAPNDPTPASSSFEGAGNVSEKPARKARRHKKHSKKKSHKTKKQAKTHKRGGSR